MKGESALDQSTRWEEGGGECWSPPKKEHGWAEWLAGDKKLLRERRGSVVESWLRGWGHPRPLAKEGKEDRASE